LNNRYQEFIAIVLIISIAFMISFYSCKSSEINPQKLSQDFAQILAEIVAIIFVLPQVIIQLTLKPQRKDVRAIFAGFIPFYFLYYLASVVLLASNLFNTFLSGNYLKVSTLFTFISSVLLIFPYLYFLIKEYSTSENIFNMKKNIIFKRIKKLVKLEKSLKLTNIQYNNNNNKSINTVEGEILELIRELKDYILTYGNEDYNFFSYGVDTVAELIEKTYLFNNSNLDNLLLEILEIMIEIGLKIDNDAYKSKINERFFDTARVILKSHGHENRINLFVTRIILIIEKIITEGSKVSSRETIRKAISIIHQISLISLRTKPPVLLEFHLIAETFKRICIFSIEHSYDNCARDVLEDLGYMVELSIKTLPVNVLPIYKVCDVLTEIGTLSSKKRKEVFSIQCVNRIISIVADIRFRDLSIDINNCMASLLELVANIWINFEELDAWLFKRLNGMKRNNKINFKRYIKPTKKILASKSLVSQAVFSDFTDVLTDKTLESSKIE